MRRLMLGLGILMASGGLGHGLPALGTIDLNTTIFVTGATLTNTSGVENARGDDFGAVVADDILETAATGVHAVSPVAIFSGCQNGITYTADLIVKPFGRSSCLFQISGATNSAYVCVDLLAKTSGAQNQLLSWSVTDLIGGYKQVRIRFTSIATEAVGVTVYTAINDTTYTGIVGDISKGLTLARATISH